MKQSNFTGNAGGRKVARVQTIDGSHLKRKERHTRFPPSSRLFGNEIDLTCARTACDIMDMVNIRWKKNDVMMLAN
jgi:hypothetical protein